MVILSGPHWESLRAHKRTWFALCAPISGSGWNAALVHVAGYVAEGSGAEVPYVLFQWVAALSSYTSATAETFFVVASYPMVV